MGILRKLLGKEPFGSEPERRPEPPSPEPPRASIPPAPSVSNTAPSGEFEQRNFRPESKEAPRTVVLQQYRYGKIVQQPDGPIVSGCEHGGTEKSPDFPIQYLNHPNQIFGSEFSVYLNDPQKYPWVAEGGQIVKKILDLNGRQYAICAREMHRSERGAGTPGRDYTEMHAVAVPVEEWSIALIPQLGKILNAKGVVKRENNKAPIECTTNLLDEPLPEGWFSDDVKDMVAHILSGQKIGFQEWDVSEADFLKRLFYALACLPESIARQVSFGTGISDTAYGNVRIAHAMKVKYSGPGTNRKVGGAWKQERPEDVAFGQRYLMGLVQILQDAKTPREVMRAIQDKLGEDIKREVEEKFKIA